MEKQYEHASGIRVWWVGDCDAVAARTKEEALDWYTTETGLSIANCELDELDNWRPVSMDTLVSVEEPGTDPRITVGESITEYLKANPAARAWLAFSTEY